MKSFLASLLKRISRDLFKRDGFQEVNGFDLFYQLTYMSAVAASGISRNRIFQLGSSLPRNPAAYFDRVNLLSQTLGYDYARACSLVGLAIKSEAMVSLLLRLSNALASGQPEHEFLSEEAGVQGQLYEKEYERDLASLTKWTDAYAAVTVSASLMIIINMTSSLIYPLGDGILVGLVITAAFTAGVTAWILSRAAPKEKIDLFSKEGPWTQRTALRMALYLLPAIVVIGSLLLVLGVPISVTTLVVAVLLFPLGLVSVLAGREIDKKDREFGPFLRSLGSMAVSTGATITEALNRLDLSSFPTLESDLKRLRNRLNAAISPELCWQKFALETGSKLIGEAVTIFNDAVKLGGDPDTIAFLTADFSARTIMLRAKRKVTASTFTWLTVVMHGAVATLMVLILEIVHNFSELMNAAMPTLEPGAEAVTVPMSVFNTPEIGLYRWMTIFMVLLLSLINAGAIIATDGGHRLKLTFYLSIMLFTSGLSFLLVPPLVERIL